MNRQFNYFNGQKFNYYPKTKFKNYSNYGTNPKTNDFLSKPIPTYQEIQEQYNQWIPQSESRPNIQQMYRNLGTSAQM